MQNVTIYGERCSGTNYLENLININFNVNINMGVWMEAFFRI